jgi:hypothetical protein
VWALAGPAPARESRWRATAEQKGDMSHPLVAVLLLPVLLAASGDAQAACTNSLWNPGFDLGVTGWDDAASGGGVNVYLVAAPDDRQGDLSGYAGLVTNTSSGAGIDVGTLALESSTCVGVTEGDTVQLRGWIRVPSAQTRSGSARLVLRWSELAHCAGNAGLVEGTAISAPGDWTFVGNSIPVPLVAPPGIDSFTVGLAVTKNEAGGSFFAYYDDLSVCVPEPSAAACGAAAVFVLAGSGTGRRRRRR